MKSMIAVLILSSLGAMTAYADSTYYDLDVLSATQSVGYHDLEIVAYPVSQSNTDASNSVELGKPTHFIINYGYECAPMAATATSESAHVYLRLKEIDGFKRKMTSRYFNEKTSAIVGDNVACTIIRAGAPASLFN